MLRDRTEESNDALVRSLARSLARSSIQQTQTPRCVYHALIHALYTFVSLPFRSAGIHIYIHASSSIPHSLNVRFTKQEQKLEGRFTAST
jgi:hypothetical protein